MNIFTYVIKDAILLAINQGEYEYIQLQQLLAFQNGCTIYPFISNVWKSLLS